MVALGLAVTSGAGCGGEIPVGPSGGGGSGAAGGAGGAGGMAPCGGADTTGCNLVVEPSADDAMTLQTALIDVMSGQTVCLCPGTYLPDAELDLATTDVTIRGVGATRDDVVIDFANQMEGDDGLSVTSDGFTIENLTVKNSPGNGIVVNGAEDVTFRNLFVTWDGEPSMMNGAYAVYPIDCDNVLVEDSEVYGASDAGIYVGQSRNIIVRNNVVHGNVAGIEIENSIVAEVYGNEAYDNTGGILVFALENLTQKEGTTCNVHDNIVRENNRANFGVGVVGAVPQGSGILVLAADETEIHDNTITDNNSFGITVVSCPSLAQLDPDYMCNDPMTDDFAEGTYIYENTFMNNGQMIAPILAALGYPTLPDVVWDGCEAAAGMGQLCFGTMPGPTFLDARCTLVVPADDLTDPAAHMCELPMQPPVQL
jgi:parallel beta-helix repeat protein